MNQDLKNWRQGEKSEVWTMRGKVYCYQGLFNR